MEQKLLIRTPSKATKTSTSTPKTALYKDSSFEDPFARTVLVSSPSPSSLTFSKVSSSTVPEKAQSATHFRQQLHEGKRNFQFNKIQSITPFIYWYEVQSIVCRFEGEIQVQQQEGLKASWEIAELQTQFDYLLRTTEELAQNNSGEFARLDLLYERYDHILEIFNKFEVALISPLQENASVRESLISDGKFICKALHSLFSNGFRRSISSEFCFRCGTSQWSSWGKSQPHEHHMWNGECDV